MGTAEWLESIGLAEYVQRFAENAIDLSILRDLTDQDLKELGVLLGHRRKMLRAIAEHNCQVASFSFIGWLWFWSGRWRRGCGLAKFCDGTQHLATMSQQYAKFF